MTTYLQPLARLSLCILALVISVPLEAYAATTPSNATVRIPRNIRVRITGTNNTYTTLTLPMDTYVARVLSHEWFSSWGDYSGGINSLAAGSAAIRSYSIAKLNSVSTTSTFDICDTSACQVYGPTSSTNANIAVSQTTGFVILGSNLAITNSEYSAENNSKALSCGDGYTSPAAGCLFDPVCLGETRNGHGRGMCQWGSAKWATGLKMAGDNAGYPASANTGLTNGYPKQTWDWIVNHYYPGHTLWRGTPLVEGDNVFSSLSIPVRMNADGTISNDIAQGMSAPLITQKSAQSTGVVVTNNPNYVVVTNDGFGFTWYKIQWSDGTVGWSPENWLQRDIPAPSAPFSLTATVISPTQVNLAWSDTNSTELGFEIQRARGTNWYTVKNLDSNATSYIDTELVPGKTYSYRVRVFNAGTNSNFSNTVLATIPKIPPTLGAISDQTISEGALLTFTNTATAPDLEQTLIDFESSALGKDAMFRWPTYSGSTYNFIDVDAPANTQTTNTFPA